MKNLKIILALLITCIYLSEISSQIQIGSDIDGEAQDDLSGSSISLSNDGKRIAIGAEQNDGNGPPYGSGHVRVYELIGQDWVQIGSDIDVEDQFTNSGSGLDVAISGDGSHIAVGRRFITNINGIDAGHVRVYKYENSDWIQIGNDIDGGAGFDWFGYSVSLSNDGSRVAIGAPNSSAGNFAGYVKVYELDDDNWIQLGQAMEGEEFNDFFGSSVSLSDNGNVLAIGSPYAGVNGQVHIYELDSGNWSQLGEIIHGENDGDLFGSTIELSGDGKNLIVGTPTNSDNGFESGQVQVFKFDDSDWFQLGSDINGSVINEELGTAVTISHEGNRIVVGVPGLNNRVLIFDLLNDDWIPYGSVIQGESTGDLFGNTASISKNGNILAIGAPQNDGINGINSGHVRIFDLSTTVSTQEFKNNDTALIIYPNPAQNNLQVYGAKEGQITIIDSRGSIKLRSNLSNSKIDISGLAKGVYIITLYFKDSILFEKILVN